MKPSMMITFLLVTVVLIFILTLSSAHNSSSFFNDDPRAQTVDFANGHLCYACLLKPDPKSPHDYEFPTFDIRNIPINNAKRKTLGPCAFHSKEAKFGARCGGNTPNYKCFIEVIPDPKGKKGKGRVLVRKGCMDAPNVAAGSCVPPTDSSKSIKRQTCYCGKRLCNSDLLLMGGDPDLAEKMYFPNSYSSGWMTFKMGQWRRIMEVAALLVAVSLKH